MTEHTEGPWNVSGILAGGFDHESVNADGPQAIAKVILPWIGNLHVVDAEGECAANARLIAVAPEFLEAAKRFVKLAKDTNITEYLPDSEGEAALGRYAIARRPFLDSVAAFRVLIAKAEKS